MDQKQKSFAIAALRRSSYRWPSRSECLKKSRIKRGWYTCAICKKEIPKKSMQLDHILPIVPITGWDNFDGYIERLLVNTEGWQTICKEPCHKEKSLRENELRRKNCPRKKKNIK